MFPREFKNWKYKMLVGTAINLCDQRPADSRVIIIIIIIIIITRADVCTGCTIAPVTGRCLCRRV